MARDRHDWTASAAKWVVVVVLGGASIGGIAWTIRTRLPRVPVAPGAPIAVAPAETEPLASRGDPDTAVGQTDYRESPEPGVAETESSRSEAKPASGTAPRLININTASAAELELLPQIGPTLAARIVAERNANGPFASLEDIERVRGIGPRTVEKIRDLAVAR